MAKIEIDVKLLLCTCEIIAEIGDQVMVFNNAIIGVLPRNTTLSLTESLVQCAPKAAPPAPVRFDPDAVYDLLFHSPHGLTTREVNQRMGYAGHAAGNTCSGALRKWNAIGRIEASKGRYPVWSAKHPKLDTDAANG